MVTQDPDELEEEGEFSGSEDLLNSLSYGVREFYLTDSWDKSIIGVLLEETSDSFLIAMPMKVSKTKNMVYLEEIMPDIPYTRFLKSGVLAVIFSIDTIEKKYIEFIKANSSDLFPELLSIIGEDEYEESHIEKVEEIKETEGTASPLKGILLTGNLTEEELKDRVETAIAEGRFIPPNGKLPN